MLVDFIIRMVISCSVYLALCYTFGPGPDWIGFFAMYVINLFLAYRSCNKQNESNI